MLEERKRKKLAISYYARDAFRAGAHDASRHERLIYVHDEFLFKKKSRVSKKVMNYATRTKGKCVQKTSGT